ncbi:hypothetical protein LINGRAHAP2_LOCUS20504, partial [Linum grandiflorum]
MSTRSLIVIDGATPGAEDEGERAWIRSCFTLCFVFKEPEL